MKPVAGVNVPILLVPIINNWIQSVVSVGAVIEPLVMKVSNGIMMLVLVFVILLETVHVVKLSIPLAADVYVPKPPFVSHLTFGMKNIVAVNAISPAIIPKL